MSCFSIDVQPLAGTTIEQAVSDAKDLATKPNLAFVRFDFNGVSMNITSACNEARAVSEFHVKLSAKEHKWVHE
jgi:hypothetical protein